MKCRGEKKMDHVKPGFFNIKSSVAIFHSNVGFSPYFKLFLIRVFSGYPRTQTTFVKLPLTTIAYPTKLENLIDSQNLQTNNIYMPLIPPSSIPNTVKR